MLMKVFGTVFPLLSDSRAKVYDVPDARRMIVTLHQEIFNAIEQLDEAMAKHVEELWRGHRAASVPAK